MHDIFSMYVLSPVLNPLNVALKQEKNRKTNVQVISRWDLRKPAHHCCQKAAGGDGRMLLRMMGAETSDSGGIPLEAAEKTALHRTPKEYDQLNAQFYCAINS